jgi:hypothetical protein
MFAQLQLRVVVIAFFTMLGVSLAQAQSFLGGLTGSRPVPANLETTAEVHGQAVPAKTSFSTDQSDLWGNPGESGWGMQLVQQADVIFATLFVYGQDGKPKWYIATLTSTGFTWSGNLIETSGPYFGAVWNLAAVSGRTVGTLTFTSSTISFGSLTYIVDGVVVTKSVQRTLLRYDNYDGTYQFLLKGTNSGCSNPAANGDFFGTTTGTILRNGPSMTLQFDNPPPDASCALVGAYSQFGKFGQFEYTASCTSGVKSAGLLFEMSNRREMVNARLTGSDNTGCNFTARLTGLML